MNIQIPKNIFFIWIGEKIPAYAKNAIIAFKQVNPAFQIYFKYFKNIQQSNDAEFNFCINCFLDALNKAFNDKTDIIYKKLYTWYSWQLHLMGKFINYDKTKKYTIFDITAKMYAHITDGYRFYLLYKYGGIYLDCDTFPVKPFDTELLNSGEFRAEHDIYFLGSHINNYFLFIKPDNWETNAEKTDIFQTKIGDKYSYEDAKLFFSGKLKYNFYDYGKNYYIHHFCNRSWLN